MSLHIPPSWASHVLLALVVNLTRREHWKEPGLLQLLNPSFPRSKGFSSLTSHFKNPQSQYFYCSFGNVSFSPIILWCFKLKRVRNKDTREASPLQEELVEESKNWFVGSHGFCHGLWTISGHSARNSERQSFILIADMTISSMSSKSLPDNNASSFE